MEPLDAELEEGELELPAEPMHLNMGPSHPAMHGTVRMVLEVEGEPYENGHMLYLVEMRLVDGKWVYEGSSVAGMLR